ncbi:MAG: hypothetical protein Q8M06_07360 [Methanobacteriaceae archaeon]|nr:hypothetical protein [Methanobacteriaceae archaeon]
MIEYNRFAREKSTAKIYKDLKENEGPLNGKNYNIVFPLAIALGFADSDFKIPIQKSDYFLKPENFGKYLFPIVHALSLYEKDDLEIFTSTNAELYKPVEEYANSGIHLLNENYSGNEYDIIDDWCNEIKEIFKEEKIIERIEKLDL